MNTPAQERGALLTPGNRARLILIGSLVLGTSSLALMFTPHGVSWPDALHLVWFRPLSEFPGECGLALTVFVIALAAASSRVAQAVGCLAALAWFLLALGVAGLSIT